MSRLIDADKLKSVFNYLCEQKNVGTITLEAVEAIIDTAPTVNQWIPCSEEMPPVGKTVLVTVKTDNDTWTYCDTWYQGDWMAYMGKDREVIAWCELPEPYKEVDNG